MARRTSPLALFSMLMAGVLVGLLLGRGDPRVSAQSGATARPAPPLTAQPTAAHVASPPAQATVTPRAVGEEAIYQELSRQYEAFRTVDRTFEMVARAVSPAVVHIVSRKNSKPRAGETTTSAYEETGSGVIVRPERGRGLYVLTNHHVIEGASPGEVNIVLHDGRVLHPLQTWSDSKADIAVLRLGRDDLPYARLGNSDEAKVGHWVLALGSPFGLTHSVSQGIISARGRHEDELQEDGVENQDFLQTDAAINPGNSGGPLVNMKGEVIGINTAIASNGGGSEGVGFSIPINLARWIMSQLVSAGKVSRGAMGVELYPELKHDKALALGLDRPRGAWVLSVWAPSPASEAGLKEGDVIIRFNGTDVVNLNHLINMVSMTPIGRTVEVVLWRDRKELVANVRIADQDSLARASTPPTERLSPSGLLRRAPRPPAAPSEEVSANVTKAFGLELITLDPSAAKRLGLAETLRGVAIVRVDPNSPLAPYCKPRDVIGTINGLSVRTADEAARALLHPGAPNPMELVVQRAVGGTMQWRTLRAPR